MRKIKDSLQKHTLQLFAGDYAKLQELHPEVGAAHIIRNIIRTYINKIEPPVDVSKIKGDQLDV
jgi:hypothetical protein